MVTFALSGVFLSLSKERVVETLLVRLSFDYVALNVPPRSGRS